MPLANRLTEVSTCQVLSNFKMAAVVGANSKVIHSLVQPWGDISFGDSILCALYPNLDKHQPKSFVKKKKQNKTSKQKNKQTNIVCTVSSQTVSLTSTSEEWIALLT